MPWVTDDELEAAVKGAIGIDPDTPLPSHFENVIPWANRDAYYAVRAALLVRGYSADQVDDWEFRTDFNLRMGVCRAIKRAAMRGEGYDLASAVQDCKDAAEELKTVAVVATDGTLTTPATGRISTGDLDTDGDRTQLSDPPTGQDGAWFPDDKTRL